MFSVVDSRSDSGDSIIPFGLLLLLPAFLLWPQGSVERNGGFERIERARNESHTINPKNWDIVGSSATLDTFKPKKGRYCVKMQARPTVRVEQKLRTWIRKFRTIIVSFDVRAYGASPGEFGISLKMGNGGVEPEVVSETRIMREFGDEWYRYEKMIPIKDPVKSIVVSLFISEGTVGTYWIDEVKFVSK